MQTNYRIDKQGEMSGMMLTHDPVNNKTIFETFDEAKDALLNYADELMLNNKELRELVKCIKGIQEKRLDYDETHLEL